MGELLTFIVVITVIFVADVVVITVEITNVFVVAAASVFVFGAAGMFAEVTIFFLRTCGQFLMFTKLHFILAVDSVTILRSASLFMPLFQTSFLLAYNITHFVCHS